MGGVAHHGHQQPVVDGDGQADVDVGQEGDPGLGDLGVECGCTASARAAAATT